MLPEAEAADLRAAELAVGLDLVQTQAAASEPAVPMTDAEEQSNTSDWKAELGGEVKISVFDLLPRPGLGSVAEEQVAASEPGGPRLSADLPVSLAAEIAARRYMHFSEY